MMNGWLIIQKMSRVYQCLGLIALVLFLLPSIGIAGPFYEGSEFEPYHRVPKDSAELVAWATGYTDVIYGSGVDDQWKTPEKALGKAVGDAFDIVSLGEGGSIVLTFDPPIKDGPGWDFAVFENGFVKQEPYIYFLELAYVEVSSDGVNYVRFDNVSLTQDSIGTYDGLDYTNIHGLASKYPQGYGTPFDLSDLAYKTGVKNGKVDLNHIRFVRIVDIVGDGSCFENRPPDWGNNGPIYDPYPTQGSGGFDLDAIGIRYQAEPDVLPGDINGDGTVDMDDASIALDVLAGKSPNSIRPDYSSSGADINGDGKVGMEEVLYILQHVSQ